MHTFGDTPLRKKCYWRLLIVDFSVVALHRDSVGFEFLPNKCYFVIYSDLAQVCYNLDVSSAPP